MKRTPVMRLVRPSQVSLATPAGTAAAAPASSLALDGQAQRLQAEAPHTSAPRTFHGATTIERMTRADECPRSSGHSLEVTHSCPHKATRPTLEFLRLPSVHSPFLASPPKPQSLINSAAVRVLDTDDGLLSPYWDSYSVHCACRCTFRNNSLFLTSLLERQQTAQPENSCSAADLPRFLSDTHRPRTEISCSAAVTLSTNPI